MDEAKQSHQRNSGVPKASQLSRITTTQAPRHSNIAASSSANLEPTNLHLLAADENDTSLLHGGQQQQVLQGNLAARRVMLRDSNEKQQQSARLNQQLPHCVVGGIASSSKARGNPASSSDLVDLTLDDSEILPVHEPKSKRLRHQEQGTSQLSQPFMDPASRHVTVLTGTVSASAQWTCSVCTLLNEDLSLQCCACGTVRPAGFQIRHLASCHSVTHSQPVPSVDGNAWKCKFCSLLSATASSRCSACGHWRYSYGAPHASRPTV